LTANEMYLPSYCILLGRKHGRQLYMKDRVRSLGSPKMVLEGVPQVVLQVLGPKVTAVLKPWSTGIIHTHKKFGRELLNGNTWKAPAVLKHTSHPCCLSFLFFLNCGISFQLPTFYFPLHFFQLIVKKNLLFCS